MDKQRVATELVKLSRALTAGRETPESEFMGNPRIAKRLLVLARELVAETETVQRVNEVPPGVVLDKVTFADVSLSNTGELVEYQLSIGHDPLAITTDKREALRALDEFGRIYSENRARAAWSLVQRYIRKHGLMEG